jgi:hypothetical protein
MYRRSLLSLLGVSVAGGVRPGFGSAPDSQRRGYNTQILALESFCAKAVDHLPRVHSYLSGTLQPAVEKIHSGPFAYLEAIIAPKAPEVVALTVYKSFDEMLATRDRVSTHTEVRRLRAELESSRTLAEVNSQVLVASQGGFDRLGNSFHFRTGVFELVSLYAPGWQAGNPGQAAEVLSRAGIRPAGSPLSAAGEHLPRFSYLIPFESMSASLEAWAKLDADPEWTKLQRASEARHGSPVKLTSKAIYKLAPYSPIA